MSKSDVRIYCSNKVQWHSFIEHSFLPNSRMFNTWCRPMTFTRTSPSNVPLSRSASTCSSSTLSMSTWPASVSGKNQFCFACFSRSTSQIDFWKFIVDYTVFVCCNDNDNYSLLMINQWYLLYLFVLELYCLTLMYVNVITDAVVIINNHYQHCLFSLKLPKWP